MATENVAFIIFTIMSKNMTESLERG